jgi:S1-C subfamily serine protease
MKHILRIVAVLAAATCSAPVLAEKSPPTPPAPSAPSPPPAAQSAADDAALEARLEAARARLDAAAREVAELSSESAGPIVERVFIHAGGPRRAIIGVQVDPTSDRSGARVAQVSPGGPAAEAGLRRGDVIVALGGAEFAAMDDPARLLVERMRTAAPDEKLPARVLRDGKPLDLYIVARRSPMPQFDAAAPPPAPRAPRAPGMPGVPAAPEAPGRPGMHVFRGGPDTAFDPFMLPFPDPEGGALEGLELANLSPQLGRYFGAERGVLVLRVPPKGPWKLQDGDVIQSIDGRVPTSGSHATRILRSYQAGEKVRIRVLRDRKPLDVEVDAPGGDVVIRRERRVIRTD